MAEILVQIFSEMIKMTPLFPNAFSVWNGYSLNRSPRVKTGVESILAPARGHERRELNDGQGKRHALHHVPMRTSAGADGRVPAGARRSRRRRRW